MLSRNDLCLLAAVVLAAAVQTAPLGWAFPGAGPMQAVETKLSDGQLIDLAAYVGSRPAWTRAEMAAALAEH